MRRADRLFQIVQHLRSKRLTTARQLAHWLVVSERTIYRDISDLSLSGVPIQGEAGVGYRIDKGFDLPPIMFTKDEIDALVAGARMIEAWGGPALAAHARSAMAKVALALPRVRSQEPDESRLFALGFHVPPAMTASIETIRQGLAHHRKLRFAYAAPEKPAASRIVLPLGLYFWGTAWILAAWCESRADFRNFRLDRIQEIELLDETFEETPGRTLADMIQKMRDEGRA